MSWLGRTKTTSTSSGHASARPGCSHPRGAGEMGGLALDALVKQKEYSDLEDHGMGWVGTDLKTIFFQPDPFSYLWLDQFAPSPSCPWRLPWIPLFGWKWFLKQGQRATLPDLGTITRLSPLSQLSFSFFPPFLMTDSPGDLLCHFFLLSYRKKRFLLFSAPSYTLLVWKLTLFQENKNPSTSLPFISSFPGQLFSSGILLCPAWILVAFNHDVLIQGTAILKLICPWVSVMSKNHSKKKKKKGSVGVLFLFPLCLVLLLFLFTCVCLLLFYLLLMLI